MKKKCCENKDPARLNKVGGQAVLEGVMMKAGTNTVTTCRKEDGSLVVTDTKFVSVRKKYPILNLPIIRGVVNFVEMMALSVKTLGASAEAMGLEEEDDGKASEWMKKHLGISLTDFIMVISVILGLALSVALFVLLPGWVSFGIDYLLQRFAGVSLGASGAVVEGGVKLLIFIGYLYLVSLMKDIRRTFMYHGAEHKSIACFEAGDELTPENAMKHKRFHPRCGTSFMFLMILIGIAAGFGIRRFLPDINVWLYTLIRLLILLPIMGIGYEIIMLAGKHDNIITRILSAPGLWVQRITTKEPTLDMLEVAIVSIKCALRDEFPEFKEFYESRGWIKKSEQMTEDGEECKIDEPADTEDKADEATDSAECNKDNSTVTDVATNAPEVTQDADTSSVADNTAENAGANQTEAAADSTEPTQEANNEN